MTAPLIGATTAAGTLILLPRPMECGRGCGRVVAFLVNYGGRTGCVWCAGVGR